MAEIVVHPSTPGNDFKAIVEVVNALAEAMNELLAKLDADAGVTDEDYEDEIGEIDTVKLAY